MSMQSEGAPHSLVPSVQKFVHWPWKQTKRMSQSSPLAHDAKRFPHAEQLSQRPSVAE